MGCSPIKYSMALFDSETFQIFYIACKYGWLLSPPSLYVHTKIGLFSIRNHCWKALEVYSPKTCEFSMHVNCLWPKFANLSCREHFMFYSMPFWMYKPMYSLCVCQFSISLHQGYAILFATSITIIQKVLSSIKCGFIT